MERALSIMLALCMVFICMPDNSFMKADAVTGYGFSIGGVKVTSANAADILGNGVLSYDAESNTLTVNGDVSVKDIYNDSSRARTASARN
jgi:hypothetical protein